MVKDEKNDILIKAFSDLNGFVHIWMPNQKFREKRFFVQNGRKID